MTLSNKDITQAALFKGVNLNKAENKHRSKSMIESYKEQGIGQKSHSGFTRR
jgi:hypothetical protein